MTHLLNLRAIFQCQDTDQFARLVRQTRDPLKPSLQRVAFARPTHWSKELRNYVEEFKHIRRIEIRFSAPGPASPVEAILNAKCPDLAGISDRDFVLLCDRELCQVDTFIQLLAGRGEVYHSETTRSSTPFGRDFHVLIYHNLDARQLTLAWKKDETLEGWLALNEPIVGTDRSVVLDSQLVIED